MIQHLIDALEFYFKISKNAPIWSKPRFFGLEPTFGLDAVFFGACRRRNSNTSSSVNNNRLSNNR